MQIEHCLDITKSLIWPNNVENKKIPKKLHVALLFDIGQENDILKPIVDGFENDTTILIPYPKFPEDGSPPKVKTASIDKGKFNIKTLFNPLKGGLP